MTDIAPARPSSTVVLARDAGASPELFLVQRPASASFGATWVFPGGVLEPDDTVAAAFCTGIDPTTADRRLGMDDGGLDYYVAAIRDLFEETGVLLGRTDSEATVLDECRQGLNDGSLDWTDFLMRRAVELDAAALSYFSHWITPNVLKKRFTTRFFVAEIPPGQKASHDPGELTASAWLSAKAALDAADRGDMGLSYPTARTLEALAGLESVAAMVGWARKREAAGVETIHPELPSEPA